MPQRQDILLDETYRHVANSLQSIASIMSKASRSTQVSRKSDSVQVSSRPSPAN